MKMLRKIGRLFTIKTRTEAWLVTYAIAVGSVERGQHYLHSYPGYGGYLLALAATGVVFVAGAKLLDSVKPKPTIAIGPYAPPTLRREQITDSRPTGFHSRRGSGSRRALRTGLRRARLPFVHSVASPEDQTHNPHS